MGRPGSANLYRGRGLSSRSVLNGPSLTAEFNRHVLTQHKPQTTGRQTIQRWRLRHHTSSERPYPTERQAAMSLQEAVKVRTLASAPRQTHLWGGLLLCSCSASLPCELTINHNTTQPPSPPQQALRLVKTDLEETKRAKAAMQAEGETKDATIATLQSKVYTHVHSAHVVRLLAPYLRRHTNELNHRGWLIEWYGWFRSTPALYQKPGKLNSPPNRYRPSHWSWSSCSHTSRSSKAPAMPMSVWRDGRRSGSRSWRTGGCSRPMPRN